jgi:hypothetical protein
MCVSRRCLAIHVTVFSHQNCVCSSDPSHACHMPGRPHSFTIMFSFYTPTAKCSYKLIVIPCRNNVVNKYKDNMYESVLICNLKIRIITSFMSLL